MKKPFPLFVAIMLITNLNACQSVISRSEAIPQINNSKVSPGGSFYIKNKKQNHPNQSKKWMISVANPYAAEAGTKLKTRLFLAEISK